MDWQEGQGPSIWDISKRLSKQRPHKDIVCNCSYLDLLPVSTDDVSHGHSEKFWCPQLHSIPLRPP